GATPVSGRVLLRTGCPGAGRGGSPGLRGGCGGGSLFCCRNLSCASCCMVLRSSWDATGTAGGFFSPGRETIGLTGCLGSTNLTPRVSTRRTGGGVGVTGVGGRVGANGLGMAFASTAGG